MASSVVGTLRVLLTASSAEFEAAMKKAADSAKVWSRDLQSIGKQASDVGATLTKALTVPIAGLAVGSIKAASDFESSFAGIRKTVSDATDSMGNLTPVGEALAQSMRDLAKEIPINVNELNRIGEAAGQLGIKSENIMGFTRVMADLGVTTNLSSDQAASALARLANITGMPQERFEDLGNVIVHLGNNLATTEAEIVEFGLRIAGAGAQVGLTEGQILAFGGALSSVGINAEAGGTAISKVFITLANEVANGGEKLEKFAAVAGMTSAQFAKQFKEDAAGATVAFVEGLGRIRNEGGNVFGVIESLGMSEIRLRDALLRASGAGDLLRNSLELQSEALRNGNALSTEAAQRYRTFENQLKLFWAQVRDVGIELGNVLLPVLREMLTNAQPLIQSIGQLAQAFAAMPAPIQQGVMAAGALLAALGPMLFVFGQITTSLGTLVGAFAAKGIAMRALSPILTSYTAQVGTATVATRGLWASLAGPAGLVAGLVATGVATSGWRRTIEAVLLPPLGLIRTGMDAWRQATTKALDVMKPMASHASIAAQSLTQVRTSAAGASTSVAVLSEEAKKAASELKKFQESVDFFGVRANHANYNALTPLRETIEDTGTTIRNVAAGFDQHGDVIVTSFEEQAAASAEAARQLDEFMRRGGMFSPTVEQMRTDLDEGTTSTKTFRQGLRELGSAFADLAQIAGSGGLAKFLREIGELIAAVGIAEEAGKKFGESWKAITQESGKLRDNLPGLVTGVASLAAAFAQVTSTTNSAQAAIGAFSTVSQFALSAGASGGAAAGFGIVGALVGWGIAMGNARKQAREMRQAMEAQFDAIRESIIDLLPPTGDLREALRALGLDWDAVFASNGVFAASVEERLQRITELQEQFRERLQATNEAFAPLLSQAVELGQQLPQSLLDSIEHLTTIGVLTGQNADLFAALTGQGEVNWKKMQEAAEKYGIELSGLGPKFQSARLHESAQTIWNDFKLLVDSGADVGTVLTGMQDEISNLVQDSLAFGTAIPENFRPLIEELMRSGQLVGENGEALTDLSQLQFGPPIQTAFERIIEAIEKLIATLSGGLSPAFGNLAQTAVGAGNAAAAAFSNATNAAHAFANALGSVDGVTVNTHFEPVDVPHMASGGIVTAPTLAMVGEGRHAEAVIPLDGRERSMFGTDKLQTSIDTLNQNFTRWMRRQPQTLAIAMQEALLLAGRRA